MLAELEGRVDAPKAPTGTGRGAKAARHALIREDRAQRLTVPEVNDALTSRCEHFSILHKPWDQIRAHGARRTAHGARRTAHGAGCRAHGARRTAHGARRTAHGARRRVHGAGCRV
eukprot:4923696-Prymnesium_polylepis.1